MCLIPIQEKKGEARSSEKRKNKADKRRDPSRRRKGRRRGERRRGRRGKGKRGGRARRGPGRGRRREWHDNSINGSFVVPEGGVEGQPSGATEAETEAAAAVANEAEPGTGTPPGGEWKWSGCDDNVGFGYRIARDFMDWRYLRGRGSQDIRSIVMLHNNEVGRLVSIQGWGSCASEE